MIPVLPPTTDQCSSHTPVDGGFACWYPQMGGYVGKAIVYPLPSGCFDVLIWHDGEFPFDPLNEDGDISDSRGPIELHHCDPQQFVDFGNWVASLKGGEPPSP